MTTIKLLSNICVVMEGSLYEMLLRVRELGFSIDAKGEVGWFQKAKKYREGTTIVYEIEGAPIIPEQVCSGGETDIKHEMVVEMLEKGLISDEEYSAINVWGHSHPGALSNPSGQDVATLAELASMAEAAETFYIGIIVSSDKITASIYDYEGGYFADGLRVQSLFESHPETTDVLRRVREAVKKPVVKEILKPMNYETAYYGVAYPTETTRGPAKKDKVYAEEAYDALDYLVGKYPSRR